MNKLPKMNELLPLDQFPITHTLVAHNGKTDLFRVHANEFNQWVKIDILSQVLFGKLKNEGIRISQKEILAILGLPLETQVPLRPDSPEITDPRMLYAMEHMFPKSYKAYNLQFRAE